MKASFAIKTIAIIIAVSAMSALLFAAVDRYEVDFKDPVSVVRGAARMLLVADYQSLLEVTEGLEKKKTEDTVAAVKSNPSATMARLKAESQQIYSFEILDAEIYTNSARAVVHTKWLIKIPAAKQSPYSSGEPTAKREAYSPVYVDYLLKGDGDKWLIISKQTR